MKILLVCGAGASSGFMAQSMRKAAKKKNLDIEIIARSDAELHSNIQGADLLLVGPHLEYNAESIKKEIAQYNVPMKFIDKDAYGAIDGETILNQALDFLNIDADKLPKAALPKAVAETKKEGKKAMASDTGTAKKDVTQSGFFKWMNNSFAPKLNKVVGNHYVAAIQESIMSVLPMIMVGSVASIVSVMKSFFPGIPDISLINTFSFGLIAIFLAYLLPVKVMEKKGLPKLKISAALTSVAMFFIIVMPTFNEKDGTITLVQSKIGTGGMIVSVVVGIFTTMVFVFASKYSLFKKDTVMPDMVVTWIDALIPVTVCLVVGLLIYNGGFDLCLFIRGLFAPIAAIGQTLPGIVLCCFLTCFLYSFGFTWILFPIVWTIWMDGMAANIAAVAAGYAATSLNLMETVMGITYIGGQGATLTLVLLMMFSKSKRLKTMGRVVIFPSIFNINEPVVFGAPVVWNPILMIPLWLNSIVLPTLMYIAFNIGFAPVPVHAFQMWYLPVYVQAFFGTGSVMGVVLCLILTAVSFIIWFPFFKVYEAQEVLKEKEELKLKAKNA